MVDTCNGEHVAPLPGAFEPEPAQSGERQFIEALPLITSLIDLLCRQHYLPGGDDDEFRSLAMFKLIENDYEVLRRFRGDSRLRTYLLVVLQRVLLDHRVRQWGKWRPSVEARRRGSIAVRLEQLTSRDGMSVEEAIVSLQTNDRVEESAETLRELAAHLPVRRRVRLEPEEALATVIDSHPLPDAIAARADDDVQSARVRGALRATLNALPPQERLILKLRYVDGLSIVQIARLLQIDARPLYRRVERILSQVRRQMHERGVDDRAARQLFAAAGPA
jgi:RNA polymerase sigma factor (sigma-70 family)